MALTLTALLLVALPVLGSTATAAAAGAQSIRRVECSDHLHTPWIALYEEVNFGGRCNAYEGTGIIELPSGVANTASSINVGANGWLLGPRANQRDSWPVRYGTQIADLRTIGWNDHIAAIEMDS
jgi:hypothetical protein